MVATVVSPPFDGIGAEFGCRKPKCCIVEGILWNVGAWKGAKGLYFAFDLVAMAIVVDVTLISGQRVSLEADVTASAQSLAESARRALGVGRGRLFTSPTNLSRPSLVMGLSAHGAKRALAVTAVPCKSS